MNRRVRIRCAMVPFMQWCRDNGVPVCLLRYRIDLSTRSEETKTRSSSGVIQRFGHIPPRLRRYRFIIRDHDLDLVTLYAGSVTVLR